MPRIAVWGTFDVANYGDLLFPRIFDHEIARRLPSAEVRQYSPLGKMHPVDMDGGNRAEPLFPHAQTQKKQIARGLDLLAIGGGEIIHFEDDAYSLYYRAIPQEALPLRPSEYFVDGLGADLEKKCPVAWHAVGVPMDFTQDQAVRVRKSLTTKRYLSVRDDLSRARLLSTGFDGQINVVPDSALLVDRVLPPKLLRSRLHYLRTMHWYPPEEQPLVLHGNGWLSKSVVDELGTSIRQVLDELPDLPIVLLEIAPCHRDGDFADRLSGRLGRPVFRLPGSARLEDIASAIAHARLFAGFSLHGHITSAVHHVPSVIINTESQSKLDGFARLMDREEEVVRETSSLASSLREALKNPNPPGAPLMNKLIRAVDGHFDRMAEIAEINCKLRFKKDAPLRSAKARASKIQNTSKRAGRAGQVSGETFICNVCGRQGSRPLGDLSREVVSCEECQSTPRFRAIVSVLANELFGRSIPLSDFPVRPDIRGLGLSDWPGYAAELSDKLGYVNTFYDREPRLDITALPKSVLQASFDFLIASDVFEHVAPPVETAFHHALLLLKPGGSLILSVPYILEGQTLEHFPSLHTYRVVPFGDKVLIVNRTEDGRYEIFDDLRVHEGGGITIEMRIFSLDGLIESLHNAGFVDIKVAPGDPESGGIWPDPWSLPVVARRPQDEFI